MCKFEDGRVNPKADIKVLQRSASTALIDGDNGIGHLVITTAANLALELARETGIGWVGVRKSNHAGAAGIYPEMIASRMAWSACMRRSRPQTTWRCGARPKRCSAPIRSRSRSRPARSRRSCSTSRPRSLRTAPSGSTRSLARRCRKAGWCTARPASRSPIRSRRRRACCCRSAATRAAGIALMIGLLAGVLNGAAFARDVVDATAPGSGPSNTGQFVLALDVTRFMPAGSVRCRGGPAAQRAARVAEIAGRRGDPDPRRGSRAPARRAQHQRRVAAARPRSSSSTNSRPGSRSSRWASARASAGARSSTKARTDGSTSGNSARTWRASCPAGCADRTGC